MLIHVTASSWQTGLLHLLGALGVCIGFLAALTALLFWLHRAEISLREEIDDPIEPDPGAPTADPLPQSVAEVASVVTDKVKTAAEAAAGTAEAVAKKVTLVGGTDTHGSS